MSRESVQKKVQRKAERRNERKLPKAEDAQDPKPEDESGSRGQVEHSDEFLESVGVISSRTNDDGTTTYFAEFGPIDQDKLDEAHAKWQKSRDEESE